MHELLIKQLNEYAREYEIGTPTGDLFSDAARTIRSLCIQLDAVTNQLESALSNRESDIDIYYRQQHKWDMEYISGNLVGCYDDAGNGRYAKIFDRLKTDPEFCSRVAYQYREFLEDTITCDDEFDCLVSACKYIISSDERAGRK